MRDLPSLKALLAFEAAARRQSFAAAAEELGVTPSLISHQVRALEEALGVRFFHRIHRKVVLTDSGARYAGEIAAAFGDIERATRAVAGGSVSDILTIHSVPSFATQWLMPRLARFSAQNLDIDVRLSASVELVDLSAGAVDVDIRYGRIIRGPGVRVQPFSPETIVPLCAPELRSSMGLDAAEDLRRVPIIHSEVNLLSWRDWLELVGVEGVDLTRGLRFDRSFMAIGAAVDGLGVCLESRLLVQKELESGKLVIPFMQNGPQVRCHSLLFLGSRANLSKIRRFRDWLFSELQACEGADTLTPG
jgi:LysR family transcriptional regulator, glycine cleavage system transcriptional activator